MKENILNFIKGVIIGIGKILPGISGASLAISLNVYDCLIHYISHLKQINKKNLHFLISIFLGFSIAIVFFSRIISYLLNNYYIYVMAIFLGILVGNTFNQIIAQKHNISLKKILIFLMSFLLVIYLFCMNNCSFNFKINFYSLTFLGVLESLTMVIPGISGSAMLMMFSMYETIIESLNSFNNLNILVPFLLGIALGLIIFIRIINYVLNKYENSYRFIIMGFMMASIFILINFLSKSLYQCEYILIVIICFFLSIFIGFKMK